MGVRKFFFQIVERIREGGGGEWAQYWEYWISGIMRVEHTFAIAMDISAEIVGTTLSVD